VHGCFLVGNPGETKETLQKTLDLAIKLNPDTAQFYPIMVYPGTMAYQWAENEGYLTTRKYDKWLTYDGFHNSVVERANLSHEELVRWGNDARRKFYLRPKYAFSKLKQMVAHPKEAKRIIMAATTLSKHILFKRNAKY
jgi:coproporphyrinogen III oxidase-like Fe-S oxidoreductase